MIEAYPLCWPAGRPRERYPEWSRFKVTPGVARDALLDEIGRLGGSEVIISTNQELRKDGLPYASRKAPQDQGVAVYFTYEGKQMCFACDKWATIAENMQAIRKTIEALRGIARWGTGDMMKRAFTGFAALPETTGGRHWTEVLGVPQGSLPSEVRAAYKRAMSATHPDKPGGDKAAFQEVQSAWEQAQKEY